MPTTEVPMLDLLATSGGQGPCKKPSLKCSKGSRNKGQGSKLFYTSTFTFLLSIIPSAALSDTSYTHSGPVSAPSVPQKGQRSESPKGCGRTPLKTCIANRLPPPHLQQHIFHSQSPKVANFRPGKNRTIAFYYQLASVYVSKEFLKGGFNSSPHFFCILHSCYYTLLS